MEKSTHALAILNVGTRSHCKVYKAIGRTQSKSQCRRRCQTPCYQWGTNISSWCSIVLLQVSMAAFRGYPFIIDDALTIIVHVSVQLPSSDFTTLLPSLSLSCHPRPYLCSLSGAMMALLSQLDRSCASFYVHGIFTDIRFGSHA